MGVVNVDGIFIRHVDKPILEMKEVERFFDKEIKPSLFHNISKYGNNSKSFFTIYENEYKGLFLVYLYELKGLALISKEHVEALQKSNRLRSYPNNGVLVVWEDIMTREFLMSLMLAVSNNCFKSEKEEMIVIIAKNLDDTYRKQLKTR